MNYLLDTCVISELVAKSPNPEVTGWIDGTEEVRLYLSVITIGEIRKGIEKLSGSKRKKALDAWLNDELLIRFDGRIVSIDTEVMLAWGKLTGALEVKGKPMSAIDPLIAASALNGGFSLVTRNEDDFKESGVPIINPWR